MGEQGLVEIYLPKPSDFDNEHDMYWYTLNDKTNKLPGMGGVFNPVNLNAYQYAGNNPVKFVDPDGNFFWLLGCSKQEKRGTQFINSAMEYGNQNGIIFDQTSIETLKIYEDALNKLQNGESFAVVAIPIAAAFSGVSANSYEQILSLSNSSGLSDELPIPESLKNAIGAVDYSNLPMLIKGMSLPALSRLRDEAGVLALEYQGIGGENNQKLAEFWTKVYDLMDTTIHERAK